MMVQLSRTDKHRLVISASLCLLTYLLAKELSGSSHFVDDLYSKDPNYVDKTVARFEKFTHPDFMIKTEDLFQPKIVWLLSFPNSGTSFTMKVAKRVSNLSIATNYADEVTEDGAPSLPIYPLHEHEGPFWTGMSNPKLNVVRPLPDNYVLTKTHCGSRCSDCGPAIYPGGYMETLEIFKTRCASGHARIPETIRAASKMKRTMVSYPPERVHKAVHIVRNPFNNLVARFHLYFRFMEKDRTEFITKCPNNATGFMNYCKDFDGQYAQDDEKAFDEDTLRIIQKVPCHGEFHKYIQWHNLAFETETSLGIPVHIMHYEEYETDFDKTIDGLMAFLELPRIGEPNEFRPGHSYDDFYTAKDRVNVKAMFRKLCSKKTWQVVERYF